MSRYASEVIKQAQKWVGRKESDGSHKEIIDVYNTYKPHPRGFAMTYSTAWCAGFVSAVAINLGYTDIIPVECSCSKMVELARKKGIWVESDDRTPKPGEIILYDWDDNGKGDNTGSPDHIGYVEKVSGKTITVIEGNYKNSVARRPIQVNGRYIRGYIVPNYDEETAHVIEAGCIDSNEYNAAVKALQQAAIKDGFGGSLPSGTDGFFGPECNKTFTNAVLKIRKEDGKYVYRHRNLTKWVQSELGFVGDDLDGKYGVLTEAAVKRYQTAHGLEVDGEVGINTYKSLAKVK